MKKPWYEARFRDMNLTDRQTQVMELIAKGKTYPEIGLILGCSASTAKNHGSAIRYKLVACNKAAAVALWKDRKSSTDVT